MLIGPKVTTIDFDCGAILIAMPLKINAKGVFSARGSFEDMSSGPVDPDQPVDQRPVSVRGKFGGDILDLTIRVSGEPAPRRLRLEKDRRVKLIRCM